MIGRLIGPLPGTTFRWEHVVENHYRIFTGPTLYGNLSFTLEPSILFSPVRYEFYRAAAKADHKQYSFKCLFTDGQYCGCVAVDENQSEPIVLYQDRPAHSIWRSRSQLILCEDGTECAWLHGAEGGKWAVLGRMNRILEMKSADPSLSGTLRVEHPSLMTRPDGPALILFSVYLAIGSRRQSAPASTAAAP